MASFAGWRARRHRALYWTCAVLAAVALVGGGVAAYVSYADTGGPAGAVRGYFAALARGDAPAALAFGDIPAGPRDYLTRAVLHEQQRLAPMRDVHVTGTSRTGDKATVAVSYRLQFGAGTQQFSDEVDVQRRHDTWHLTSVAVSTQLQLAQAEDRARILDTTVPTGPVLLFPGAVPISFDTPYLQLSAATSSVQLDGSGQTPLIVEASPQGRSAVLAALRTLFIPCLAGSPSADPRCPLPTPRGVPGSLHGAITGAFVPDATVAVASVAAGQLEVSGHVKVSGRYQELDFSDLPVPHSGTVSVLLSASSYATTPLRLSWQAQS
jgi:hypothetical protein